MKQLRLVGLLATVLISSCATQSKQSWESPDHSTRLTFTQAPSGTSGSEGASYSYYSLHDTKTGERLAVVGSIISDSATYVAKQRVHYSPTGRTILIEEDVSDASPDYAFKLLYLDGSFYHSRNLNIPAQLLPDLHNVYGVTPVIVSITDDAVKYRYNELEHSQESTFKELRDVGY